MARPRWKSAVKPALKIVLTVLVLAAVARHVMATRRQLQEQGRSIQFDARLLAAGVGLYVVGLVFPGLFFGRVLRRSPSPIGPYAAVRAYVISHLGKYVPGKAMVVVMRAGLTVPAGARPATSAFATLYETLAMMAAGALLAVVGYAHASTALPLPLPRALGLGPSVDVPLNWLSLGLLILLTMMVTPWGFRRLAAAVSLPFPGVGPEAQPRITGPLLAEGLAWCGAGWLFWGLSQVAVLRAMMPAGLGAAEAVQVVAGVALATVVGFVVPITPGGLGVREWVLWTSLPTAIDRPVAVVAALALRLCWVVGEVLAAAVLLPIRPPLASPTEP